MLFKVFLVVAEYLLDTDKTADVKPAARNQNTSCVCLSALSHVCSLETAAPPSGGSVAQRPGEEPSE